MARLLLTTDQTSVCGFFLTCVLETVLFELFCLNRKLLTGAGVSICTECVSRLAVTSIATVCVHAALGTWSLQEAALIHIWRQYETLFKQQIETLVVKRCMRKQVMHKKLET